MCYECVTVTSNEVAVCTYMQAIIMALSLEDINLGKLGNVEILINFDLLYLFPGAGPVELKA